MSGEFETAPGPPGPPVSLAALRRLAPLRCLPGRNRTKADILVYRHGELTVALKDYGGRPWWVRHVLGRWLIGREARAYRRVAGVPGLPRFLGRLGPWALATEWIEGTPLPHPLDGPRPPDECFERLTALVDALHARGVALGDLHHRNVVLGASGSPHVVDLATAWLGRAGGGRQDGAWLFRRWREADRVALARLRARFDGTDPQAAAAAAAGRRPAVWHERARRLKRRWDRWRRR